MIYINIVPKPIQNNNLDNNSNNAPDVTYIYKLSKKKNNNEHNKTRKT